MRRREFITLLGGVVASRPPGGLMSYGGHERPLLLRCTVLTCYTYPCPWP
jgi:hypothetical protein